MAATWAPLMGASLSSVTVPVTRAPGSRSASLPNTGPVPTTMSVAFQNSGLSS